MKGRVGKGRVTAQEDMTVCGNERPLEWLEGAGPGLRLQAVWTPRTDSRLTDGTSHHRPPRVSSIVVSEQKGIPKKGIFL